jgi:hypothetical protein
VLDDQKVFFARFRFDLQRDLRASGAVADRVIPELSAPDRDRLQDVLDLAQEGRCFAGDLGRGAGRCPLVTSGTRREG